MEQSKIHSFDLLFLFSEDNLQNLRRENSRIFGNKKREYLKAKLMRWKIITKTKTLVTCTET
jgi:hypothetical protein